MDIVNNLLNVDKQKLMVLNIKRLDKKINKIILKKTNSLKIIKSRNKIILINKKKKTNI